MCTISTSIIQCIPKSEVFVSKKKAVSNLKSTSKNTNSLTKQSIQLNPKTLGQSGVPRQLLVHKRKFEEAWRNYRYYFLDISFFSPLTKKNCLKLIRGSERLKRMFDTVRYGGVVWGRGADDVGDALC